MEGAGEEEVEPLMGLTGQASVIEQELVEEVLYVQEQVEMEDQGELGQGAQVSNLNFSEEAVEEQQQEQALCGFLLVS